ncbi:MAG TPA: hypothetical protein VN426_02840 [Syntrophomonadaceae bacterium]|nr:hypothetical protein [Syntrophomonadaceae bacterium]
MKNWTINIQGMKLFIHGLEAWLEAAEEAERCHYFNADDEDERVTETRSCYDCRYRKWLRESIVCLRTCDY